MRLTLRVTFPVGTLFRGLESEGGTYNLALLMAIHSCTHSAIGVMLVIQAFTCLTEEVTLAAFSLVAYNDSKVALPLLIHCLAFSTSWCLKILRCSQLGELLTSK